MVHLPRSHTTHTASILLAIALSLGAGSVLSAPVANAAPTPSCPAGIPVVGDYNGDSRADLAVGVERTVAHVIDLPFTVIPQGSTTRS